jgi:hypothetical protein
MKRRARSAGPAARNAWLAVGTFVLTIAAGVFSFQARGEASSLEQTFDDFYSRRAEPAVRREALALARRVEATNVETRSVETRSVESRRVAPGNPEARILDGFGVLWRAGRVFCIEAEWATNAQDGARFAQSCWNLGDAAARVSPQRAEGFYIAASGVGFIGLHRGVINAITQGIDAKLNERLDAAVRLDGEIDFGGPWLMRGRYFQEAPWPIRDLERARLFLEKVRSKFPENLRARLYLAELYLEEGQKDGARAEIDAVMGSAGTWDPPDAPVVKAATAKLLARLSE